MVKLTKKALKEEAQYQEAYYFTGNVYSYENIIYYLDSFIYYNSKGVDTKETEENIYKNSNKNYYNSVSDLIQSIKAIKYDDYRIDKIAYSAGMYGNSGQLHTIKLFKDGNIVALYYTYY